MIFDIFEVIMDHMEKISSGRRMAYIVGFIVSWVLVGFCFGLWVLWLANLLEVFR